MKNKNILDSFKYAGTGIIQTFKQERNFKLHIIATILVVILAIYFKLETYELLACVICCGMVLISEMFNTVIEEIVNFICPKKDSRAKIIKDIAAGAVLIAATVSVVVGAIIFIPKFVELL